MADGGYLADPEGPYGRFQNPDVVGADTLTQGCVVLLGEPGLGKTTVLQEMGRALEARLGNSSDRMLAVNLAEYGSEDRVVREIFNGEEISAWKTGNYQLHLLFDSFDECRSRIPNLATLLAGQLKRCPVERLQLRLICRTADWSNTLETTLSELFVDAAVYELVPLRRTDVAALAEANGVDPHAFAAEVDRAGAVPLAIKPLTLNFLVREFASSGGRLPESQIALYQKGLEILCGEQSHSRFETRSEGSLTLPQQMVIAGRLAAISIFSARGAVWVGPVGEGIPETDVTLEDCLGGWETIKGQRFEVSARSVKEALGTGLFSSRGPNRLGWAHESYSEFLAAWYLVHRSMSLSQLRSLMLTNDRVIPQLRPVAAWLVAMAPSVFGSLVDTDPETFVLAAIDLGDDELRRRVVDGLFYLAGAGLLRRHHGSDYRRLGHATLVDQLRTWIIDRSLSEDCRDLAINVAEGEAVRPLQAELLAIVLEPDEPFRLRLEAAYAISRFGDDSNKAALLPLALEHAGEDPDDELKGVGLQAVWPGAIDASDLFIALTPPKQPNLMGSYAMFLSYHLPATLKGDHLDEALEWASSSEEGHHRRDRFSTLVDTIVRISWEHVHQPEVAKRLARIVVGRVHRHERVFGDDHLELSRPEPKHHPERRRHLLAAILQVIDNAEFEPWNLLQNDLVVSADFGWLIEQYEQESNESIRQTLAGLIGATFDHRLMDHSDAVFRLQGDSELYRTHFAWWIEAVEISSDQAQQLRDRHRQIANANLDGDAEQTLSEAEIRERISQLFLRCENGDHAAFWQLNRDLTLQPGNRYYGDDLEPDITRLPGWATLSADDRERLLECAARYLREAPAGNDHWLGTDTIWRPAWAGYRALMLLSRQRSSALEQIEPAAWHNWAPIVLTFPSGHLEGQWETKEILARRAYQEAPQAMIDAVPMLVRQASTERQFLSVRREIEACFDDRLGKALLSEFQRDLTDPVYGDVLELLVSQKVEAGIRIAEANLEEGYRAAQPTRALHAAEVLVRNVPDRAWPLLLNLMTSDPAFAKELFLKVAHHHQVTLKKSNLDADAIAALYIWLCEQFPPAEDPNLLDVHFVGPRESLAHWRDGLLEALQSAGTSSAVEALKSIAARFPERPWLSQVVLSAEEVMRKETWNPLSPVDLLELLGDPTKRLVISGPQLLEVIAESLVRLQQRLQGETPEAPFLWDEHESVRRPKNEDRLSDYIKNFLQNDLVGRGIVIGREVEVRRNTGSGIGERTDIKVDATAGEQDSHHIITAVAEIKGCWNDDLNTAMRSQLWERYMSDIGTPFGIYLVCWFDPGPWNQTDRRRRRQVSRLDKESVENALKTQAEELGAEGALITVIILDCSLPHRDSLPSARGPRGR